MKRALCAASVVWVLSGCGVGEFEETDWESLDEQPDVEEGESALISPVAGATIRSTQAVHLRAAPKASADSLVLIPSGAPATLLSATPNDGFFHIRYQGKTGWSFGKYWVNPGAALVVNGRTLNGTEASRVRYVAQNVVPHLAGDRALRIRKAARVTWWALKEGVLDVPNVWAYSNCNTPSGDARIGPRSVCSPGRAWQVGISGVQVPGHTLAELTSSARNRHPGKTPGQVLSDIAIKSGYAKGSANHRAIVNSSGSLRASWLLRDPAVGYTFQEPTISAECINNSFGWCYGTGWPTSARFAPNRAGAMRSIADLEGLFRELSP